MDIIGRWSLSAIRTINVADLRELNDVFAIDGVRITDFTRRSTPSHEGKLYEVKSDNAGGCHGYPIPGNEAPSSVLKELRSSGVINNAEYNRLRKGK